MKLQNKWTEEYKEPKEYFWIASIIGNIQSAEIGSGGRFEKYRKAIGNYFETKEEAEKAVEKLKAWKRLKDKGIFTYIDHLSFKAQEGSINFEFSKNLTPEDMKKADKDLDLLFGGEEDK